MRAPGRVRVSVPGGAPVLPPSSSAPPAIGWRGRLEKSATGALLGMGFCPVPGAWAVGGHIGGGALRVVHEGGGDGRSGNGRVVGGLVGVWRVAPSAAAGALGNVGGPVSPRRCPAASEQHQKTESETPWEGGPPATGIFERVLRHKAHRCLPENGESCRNMKGVR